VDDLVQMTFIKAFGALSTFRGEATFATWLTRIAVNTCLSHYRARWSQVGRLDDVNELDAVYCGASLESPEVAVLRKESWEQLVGGLKGLSRVYRQVMWMRFMQDRSYQEICDALDVPLGTVKTWLHRARRKLRVQFPDWREWVN
jgi:RNA polymerase sigma-70 factor (ECF subfamily)